MESEKMKKQIKIKETWKRKLVHWVWAVPKETPALSDMGKIHHWPVGRPSKNTALTKGG